MSVYNSGISNSLAAHDMIIYNLDTQNPNKMLFRIAFSCHTDSPSLTLQVNSKWV